MAESLFLASSKQPVVRPSRGHATGGQQCFAFISSHCSNSRHPRRHVCLYQYQTMAISVATQRPWRGSQRSCFALHATASGAQITHSKALLDYITQGPLLSSCQLSPADVAGNLDNWLSLGDFLANNLNFPKWDSMSESQRNRIFHYYLPVFFWCQRQLQEHRARHQGAPGPPPPLIIGISAPQGCGKTTLVEQLEALLAHTATRAAVVSIDDFYLTYEDQQHVAGQHLGNGLLEFRGNAGSHDVDLGTETLQAFRQASSEGTEVAVPRYDKSQQAGRGDRADPATWPRVQGPLDLVLFEGWMLGFRPLSAEQACAVDPALMPVNWALQTYEEAWDSFVDAWLVIKVDDPSCVYRWRLQAEHQMRDSGKPSMSDEQVADFVDRFMPAYKAYLPTFYAQGPTTAKPGRLLVIEIDENRSPMSRQPSDIFSS